MAQRRRSATSDTEFHINISGQGRTSILAAWPAFFAPGTAVIALPNWREPRLLVPSASLRVRWRASAMYPAFRRRAKAFRFLVRAAAALSILPSRRVDAGSWPVKSVIDTYVPETQSVAVLIGTSGVGQKLTAECRDSAGRVVGYMKYAEGAVAMAQLRNEASMLEAVPGGSGPKLLGCVSWKQGLLLLTRPVVGRRVRAVLPPPRSLASFARSLRRSETKPIHEHPWILRSRVADHLPRAVRVLEGRDWNLAYQHGDLAAWNVRHASGGLQAFDWEYGSRDGFPYLDLAHFVLQHAALIARWPSAKGAAVAADYIRAVAEEERAPAGSASRSGGGLSAENASRSGSSSSAEDASPAAGISHGEAAALVQLAAYDAYRNDPSPDDHPLQQWRQQIWRAGR